MGLNPDKNRNAYKSSKFFANMSQVSQADRDKKNLKREAKEKGVAMESFHNNQSAKRFKM